MRMSWSLLTCRTGLWALCLLLATPALATEHIVRLATTTSTYNSGLLDALLPVFEARSPYEVQVIPVGTGKALRLGQDGDVDMVMVHAPHAEQAFVAAGYGIEPRRLMVNDFVLVGPKEDPAAIATADDAEEALARIVEHGAVFISRGDDSGTHSKELALWESLGRSLEPVDYRAAGQGMGEVLHMASQLQGYTLTDRGTWLALQGRLDLALLYEGGEPLINPYQVILVNPARYDDLNTAGARALADWLVSGEGQAMINTFRVNGEPLFQAAVPEQQ